MINLIIFDVNPKSINQPLTMNDGMLHRPWLQIRHSPVRENRRSRQTCRSMEPGFTHFPATSTPHNAGISHHFHGDLDQQKCGFQLYWGNMTRLTRCDSTNYPIREFKKPVFPAANQGWIMLNHDGFRLKLCTCATNSPCPWNRGPSSEASRRESQMSRRNVVRLWFGWG